MTNHINRITSDLPGRRVMKRKRRLAGRNNAIISFSFFTFPFQALLLSEVVDQCFLLLWLLDQSTQFLISSFNL